MAGGNGRHLTKQRYWGLQKMTAFGKKSSQQDPHYVDLEVGESGLHNRDDEPVSAGHAPSSFFGRTKKKNRRRMNESLQEKPPLPPQQASGGEADYKSGQNGAVGRSKK